MECMPLQRCCRTSQLYRSLKHQQVQRRRFTFRSNPGSAPFASKGPAKIVFGLTLSATAYGVLSHQQGRLIGLPEALAEARPVSKEAVRDSISSQHLQVKRSWENPGVYAWGSNAGRVVAPDSSDEYVKTPRRIPYFDNVLLRDVKLDRLLGAAIDDNGDLIQWGFAHDPTSTSPKKTLVGKDLISLALSEDHVIALGSNGSVYSVPVSRQQQETEPKPSEGSWIPFWTPRSTISYRSMQPTSLAWNEKVVKISGGLEHLLMLTSKGRLFSAASSGEHFPSRGQLGIPGLIFETRPSGPADQPHEVITLRGFEIADVAAGDHHTLVVDAQGRLFGFGDNSMGQLGLDYSQETAIINTPMLFPIERLYRGSNMEPKVTAAFCGTSNSFFTVDAKQLATAQEPNNGKLGSIRADTWACGQGTFGMLGTGRWTHVQGLPKQIKALSGLFEWDEVKHRAIPIRLAQLSVGATHAAALMDNVTYVGATESSSSQDTNWGADVVWWGGNEHYQLGTGKRNNEATPRYILPLDMEAELKRTGKREEHRLHLTPKKTIRVNGRWVAVEQRVECGRFTTAVYSGV